MHIQLFSIDTALFPRDMGFFSIDMRLFSVNKGLFSMNMRLFQWILGFFHWICGSVLDTGLFSTFIGFFSIEMGLFSIDAGLFWIASWLYPRGFVCVLHKCVWHKGSWIQPLCNTHCWKEVYVYCTNVYCTKAVSKSLCAIHIVQYTYNSFQQCVLHTASWIQPVYCAIHIQLFSRVVMFFSIHRRLFQYICSSFQ